MNRADIEQNRQAYIEEQRARDRLITLAVFSFLIILCLVAIAFRADNDDLVRRNGGAPTVEEQ